MYMFMLYRDIDIDHMHIDIDIEIDPAASLAAECKSAVFKYIYI